MKKLTKQQELAFELLAMIKQKRVEFGEINRLLHKQSSFISLSPLTEDFENKIVLLVNAILGDYELAEYWLYEVDNFRKSKYHITIDKKKYNISTIEKLKDYYIKEVLND